MTDSRKYTPDAVTAVLEHMLSTAKWLDSQGLYVMANGVNSAHDIITAQAQEIEALRAEARFWCVEANKYAPAGEPTDADVRWAQQIAARSLHDRP